MKQEFSFTRPQRAALVALRNAAEAKITPTTLAGLREKGWVHQDSLVLTALGVRAALAAEFGQGAKDAG